MWCHYSEDPMVEKTATVKYLYHSSQAWGRLWSLLLLSTQYNHISFKSSVIFLHFHLGSKLKTHLVVHASDFIRGPRWRGHLQSRSPTEPVRSIITEGCFGNLSSHSGHVWVNPVCLMFFFIFFYWFDVICMHPATNLSHTSDPKLYDSHSVDLIWCKVTAVDHLITETSATKENQQ